MKLLATILCPILLSLLLTASAPVHAQQTEPDDPETPEQEQTESSEEPSAREKRIEEYLKRREERRARREAEKREREAAKEGVPAEKAVEVTGDVAGADAGKKVRLSRGLARAQETVRRSSLGADPTVKRYLERVDRGELTAQQLAAFGNFVGRAGLHEEALEYYDAALDQDRENPLLWLNLGTLYREVGHSDRASSAFSRAISIDPNNAKAHYNLGAVLDERGKYDDAVEEYKRALTLDPSLADPAVNPAAANNERLLVVKLMLYKESGGNTGLPLQDVPNGGLDPEGDAR